MQVGEPLALDALLLADELLVLDAPLVLDEPLVLDAPLVLDELPALADELPVLDELPAPAEEPLVLDELAALADELLCPLAALLDEAPCPLDDELPLEEPLPDPLPAPPAPAPAPLSGPCALPHAETRRTSARGAGWCFLISRKVVLAVHGGSRKNPHHAVLDAPGRLGAARSAPRAAGVQVRRNRVQSLRTHPGAPGRVRAPETDCGGPRLPRLMPGR